MNKSILVIGSSNIDMVVKSKKFPKAGETILGSEFQMFKGGKGANQAVSAAKLGGDVSFISKIGNDEFGTLCTEQYENAGINIENILIDEKKSTGVAMISVNESGENKIVVAPGANYGFTKADISNLREIIVDFDVLVLQLEIPVKIVGLILEIARDSKLKVILNPAPALELPQTFFKDLYLLTPNQNEVEKLTGISVGSDNDLQRCAERLQEYGVENVIITLGKRGVYAKVNEFSGFELPPEVKAEDTTAAGDVFNGALAVAIAESKSWEFAIEFANNAAALSVTKNGAHNSSPTLAEVHEFTEYKFVNF